jgi:Domain of unknown function (DUF4188)
MLAMTTSEGEMISRERLTVAPDQRFVVFLIGMRVNRWWMVPLWWPAAMAMGRMLRQLATRPDSPLLSYESYFGRTTYMVQYWRSFEELAAYAHSKEGAHVPAWKLWAKRLGLSGAVGIWHETYVIEPGSYECVYHNMPAFGLGRAFERVPAVGSLANASGRRAVAEQASA